MFWKYNHQSSPHIDTLLNKDDVTLQELMDEEDVLQECKVQNKKLIDFLIRPEVMEELVRLTTMEPSTDLDERLRYKYPNIACELLTCDVPALNERLAGDEELLGKLYTFLESESPLNPLLASFFSKTFGVLVVRKSEQNWYSYQFTCLQVLEFLKSKENFIALLLKHLGTSAIMDLLLKLITHIEGAEMKQNILNWLDSQQVIQCLIGLLDPSIDAERNSNAAQLLSDVIKISRDYQHTAMERTDPDPILNRLESPETVSLLLDHVLGAEKHESSVIGGINVLLTLLECGGGGARPGATEGAGEGGATSHHEGDDGADRPPASPVLLNTLDAILPRLGDFHRLLLEPPYKAPVKTTAGTLDPPVGKTRLHVATLITALIATNNPAVNRELANLDTVNVLLDLFFKYTWNNFLHAQVEQCIAFALAVGVAAEPTGEEDSNSNILLKNIFIKCRLIQRILEAWEENESHQTKPGGVRCGYMGHLVKIANSVATQAEKGPLGSFIKQHVPTETVTSWETFVADTLAEINKTHSVSLGGAHPVHSSSEDDDQGYPDIPFPPETALQQAFSNYQMEQAAPQFIENYGFHDEEFADSEDMLHGWQSATEGAGDSSDEEEREGPEGREEIRMEVDSTDPWAAGGEVAADADDPWGGGGGGPAPDQPPGWADFGSAAAAFADFDANFTAPAPGPQQRQESAVARREATEAASDARPASPGPSRDSDSDSDSSKAKASDPLGGSEPPADDNANPSSSSGDRELTDNYRFLSNRGCLLSASLGGEGEAEGEAVPSPGGDQARPEATENGPVETPASIVGDALAPTKGKLVPEGPPPAMDSTPNGPV